MTLFDTNRASLATPGSAVDILLESAVNLAVLDVALGVVGLEAPRAESPEFEDEVLLHTQTKLQIDNDDNTQ